MYPFENPPRSSYAVCFLNDGIRVHGDNVQRARLSVTLVIMSKDLQGEREHIPGERHSSDSATRERLGGKPKRRKRDEKNEEVHASDSDTPVVITIDDHSSPAKSPSGLELVSYPLECSKCTFKNRPSQAPGLPLPTTCAVCLEPIQISNSVTSSADCSVSEVSAGQVLRENITAKCPICTVILMDGTNATICYVCGSLLAPHSRSEMKNFPLEEWWECSACTLRNDPRTTVCGACETPLANRTKGRAGTNIAIPNRALVQHMLQTEKNVSTIKTKVQHRTSYVGIDGPRASTGIVIPTVAELTARTEAEAGDGQAATKGLIPRLQRRLMDEHGERMGVPRTERGRDGLAWRSNGLRGRKEQAEWNLCDPRTAHYTQRGFQGSEFSCGYRNIQMLCSALMEWPEYRRVLFGGSGLVPGVLLLQCWIERAWADGYDPEGCEQLGGPGALMGSEKWIGATECVALLRSFGVKAEVIDFESSTASPLETPGQVGIETARSGDNYHCLCAPGTRHEGPGPPLRASRHDRLGFSPLSPIQQQQSIRAYFVSLDTAEVRERPGSDNCNIISRPASGGCVSTGAGVRLGGYRGLKPQEDTPVRGSSKFSGGGVGGKTWPWRGSNSRTLGGARWRGGSRAGRDGRWGGDLGREAGQRMGRAIVEWAWEYFCTPWGDVEVFAEGVVGGGVGLPVAIEEQRKRNGENEPAIRARPPPPLYFQHDGHSRSIVGVLLPGGTGKVADHGSRGRCLAGAGAGRSAQNRGEGRAGSGGGKGSIHPRRPGSLLVFDPSQQGRDINRALDGERTKRSWSSMLKRGDNTLHRRQFQVVAVRPGLIEAGKANGWKKLVSCKISVE